MGIRKDFPKLTLEKAFQEQVRDHQLDIQGLVGKAGAKSLWQEKLGLLQGPANGMQGSSGKE